VLNPDLAQKLKLASAQPR